MTWTWIIGTLIAAYLVGSIPFGLIFGYLVKGVDIRQHGSRNIGATNAARVIGFKWFPLVLLLDALKGAGPCLAGHFLAAHAGADLVLFAGIGALLGHFYSCYIGFKGGKGVATGLGVVMVLTMMPDTYIPLAALCALGVFALVLAVTRIVSAASIVAAVSIPAFYFIWMGPVVLSEPLMWRFLFLIFVCLFVVVKHRANMRRMMKGEEPRIGRKQEAA
ncbi:MAG: glycerol-3-phosphate 1-O-acyltransferase PlsY [Planctomycetes bacterium]|nr:glycerol-3-phosphate 1-O-acyltransferase PlsY [Planctomycetota bacterium]